MTVVAIALAGGGFAVGRLTAPDTSASGSQCSEPRKLIQEYGDTIRAEQDAAQKRTAGRTYAHVILQNPECFSSEDRASAQTILDTIDQGAQNDAIEGLKDCVDSATDDNSWSNC
ncbi:hypothetical protein ACFRIC_08730 [Streptomyces sp. NPDC056738]|uniref:hypothetical protein n=1 Tax=Streptomyces sp. NPDC056738 TaxID=3345933 RepID=UPI0036C0FDFA